MYLGGVLGVNEPKLVQIGDENLRDAKGFHGMSFKTRPGTRVKRKKMKHRKETK